MDHADAASRAWDAHAEMYAERFAPLTSFIARSMFTMAAPQLPEGARVLDVACGSGALTLPALERARAERERGGPGGVVFATDFSATMVEITGRSAAALGAPEDLIHCQRQNGQALTYSDGEFDGVFSCFGIFLFDDRVAGWREAGRVLKPGGVFATAVWQGPETNAMLREQVAPIMQALPEALRPTSRAPWMEIADAASLEREITGLDLFTDVRVRPFHATIAMAPWQFAWDALRDNPVMRTLLTKCNPAELEAVKASLFAHFRRLAGGDDQPLLLDSACNILIARRR